MKIFKSEIVKEIDRLTIEREPITSFSLMERASVRFVQWFSTHFAESNPVSVFAGNGNNGGDALAIARMLVERKYEVRVFILFAEKPRSADCSLNLKKIAAYLNPVILGADGPFKFPSFQKNEIIIDGLFGSGLNRPVEGKAAQLIQYLNLHAPRIVSIDIPSGLFGEDNRVNNPGNIIKADYTISFQFPFLSFFMGSNEEFIGKWEIIPIGLHLETINEFETSYNALDEELVSSLLIPRKKFSHKGNFGHALVISGRYGMMGAAVLAVKSSLRGGAGLSTACVPKLGINIVQTAVPEALIQFGNSDEVFDKLPDLSPYTAIACGPAIGDAESTKNALRDLMTNSKVPLVLDADALTILSKNMEMLKQIPSGSVITPHPKEFDRLAGESKGDFSRHLKQIEFAAKYKVIVVLKGAHTIISDPDGNSFINTTGNPGMASGGSGDVLTGLLVSIIAQGYNSLNASIIAVYLHGLAADIAVENSSEESVIASDIIENLGNAFRFIKK